MDLQNDLQRVVSSAFASPVAFPSNKGNLYELYIFILLYRTIKQLNPTTSIQSPSSGFAFRCNPGVIDNSRFSFITFTKFDQIFEIRNGIQVIGHNMHHEIDVSIFSNTQANNSRPQKTDLKLAIECKNHSTVSSLKGELRKYLGCITDLCHVAHGSAGCIMCGVGFEACFATPLLPPGLSQGLTFLDSYGLNSGFDVKPHSSHETVFIDYITLLYHSL